MLGEERSRLDAIAKSWETSVHWALVKKLNSLLNSLYTLMYALVFIGSLAHSTRGESKKIPGALTSRKAYRQASNSRVPYGKQAK